MISLVLLFAVVVLYWVLRLAVSDFDVQPPRAKTIYRILTVLMLVFLIVVLVELAAGHPFVITR